MVKTLVVIVPEFSSCASSGAQAARRYTTVVPRRPAVACLAGLSSPSVLES